MWFEITSSGKFLIGVAVKASIICFWWIGPWRRVRTWQHCFRFPAVFHICVPCDEESARASASELFVYCFTISSLWVIFYKLLFVLPFLRVFVRDNYLVLYHRERIVKSSTLSCMKKRRKSPNLPQNEGTPPLFWVLSGWGRAPIILGVLVEHPLF